jgi:hypothetical protein
MTINKATFVVSGFGLLLDAPIVITKTDGGVSSVGYKSYRSSNPQKAGTYAIQLS